MKIAFLQTAHPAHDERVKENQGASLTAAGDAVDVLSTMGDSPASKCRRIWHFLQQVQPEAVICDTPFAVVGARLCSHATVVWDVTEWYPSKKDLRVNGLAYHVLKWLKTALFRLAKRMAHAYIFGETDKQAPFLPTGKPTLMLPYYPRLEYVDCLPPEAPLSEPRLLYAGPLTEDKGWPNVLKAFGLLQQVIPGIRLDVITAQNDEAPSYPGIRYLPPMPFEDFCKALSHYHIMLDLRRIDEENTRCLPIKIFYYMAAGRPVVYSQLEAIRKGIPEIDECAQLVAPDDAEAVAAAVRNYLNDSALYNNHVSRARQLAQEKYNWHQLETPFTQFIHAL